MTTLDIPDRVRKRISHLGPEAAGWLERAGTLIAEAADEWGVDLGYVVDWSSTAVVVRGRRDGEPVIVKLWPVRDYFAAEERVLRAAHGRGYAHLLASDAARQALLLEALGPALDPTRAEGHGSDAVIRLVTSVLTAAWSVPLGAVPPLPPGDHLALRLLRQIESNPVPAGVPDCTPAIERARLYAQQRLDDPRAGHEVILHGCPDPGRFRRVLAPRPGAESGFVLVSPHAVRGEREYDLGVLMRESNRPLLHSDDAVVLARSWCARLAELTDADAEVVWQWAYVQRVAHGLHLVNGPEPLAGRLYLQTAMALVDRSRR